MKKPFWQTSEFWMVIVSQLLAALFPESVDHTTATAAAGFYAVSRGLTKHGTGDQGDK
jgi:hypothetical protein